MIRRRLVPLVLLILGLAFLCLQLRRTEIAPKSVPSDAAGGSTSTTVQPFPAALSNPPASEALPNSAEQSSTDATASPAPAQPRQPAVAEPVPETPESSTLPAATVLENMRTSIRQYAAAFGENPVGTNPEIAAALQGDNPKHINFLKADGNRINTKGELVDVWGTPYFFHQLSGREMEIRSAGPDRVLYTADDLLTK